MNDDLNASQGKTLDRAIRELRDMPVPESPGAQHFLARIPRQSTFATHQSPNRFGSFFMRRAIPLTSAAAVTLLVVGWAVLSSTSATALAQVIEATTKHKLVRYRFETHAELTDAERQPREANSDEIVYFDLQSPRFRVERREKTLNDTVQSDWITVQDNQADRILVLSSLSLVVREQDADEAQTGIIKEFINSGHAGKKAQLFRINDEGLRPFTNMRTNKTFLATLKTLQDNKNTVSQTDTLDSRDVTKYRLTEGSTTTTLWVDAKTKIPVRIEQEVLNPSAEFRLWKWVYSDFEWDADVEKLNELFSLKPPAGYTLDDQTSK